MAPVTVHGPNMRIAMRRVAETLGEDALILSTRSIGEIFEIVAERPLDADTALARADHANSDRAPTSMTGFGAVFAAEISRPVRAESAAGIVPDPFARMGGWPGLSPAFARALEDELSGGVGGFLAVLEGSLTGRDGALALAAPRLALCGPAGAGKARLALYLAEARAPAALPSLAVCGTTAADAAWLIAGAGAQGWPVTLSDEEDELAAALDAQSGPRGPGRITVLSAELSEPQQVLSRMAEAASVQPVLVLPAGLHPRVLARHLSAWARFRPVIFLTGPAHMAPGPEELAAIAARGLQLVGAPGAGRIDRATFQRWARDWLRAMALPAATGQGDDLADAPARASVAEPAHDGKPRNATTRVFRRAAFGAPCDPPAPPRMRSPWEERT
ncbi:hypothetical protein EV663_10573 [Rhodovulum bhavnagarense]|uniref:Flagellar biosynthesis protein FlhF n=1 Tax=Rhodovulum bhavnagarense TaxID=992286 RepID=A0A4R2RQ95_9RHOB|nr:hypothetical protein [Rhodovulum bhavnagarense]TCP61355.1 hypothetical protein EV663_10573 [Rhodovulum bhavnagarense]